jgi:hypothetical protein
LLGQGVPPGHAHFVCGLRAHAGDDATRMSPIQLVVDHGFMLAAIRSAASIDHAHGRRRARNGASIDYSRWRLGKGRRIDTLIHGLPWPLARPVFFR